jgi:hypothetical protein
MYISILFCGVKSIQALYIAGAVDFVAVLLPAVNTWTAVIIHSIFCINILLNVPYYRRILNHKFVFMCCFPCLQYQHFYPSIDVNIEAKVDFVLVC